MNESASHPRVALATPHRAAYRRADLARLIEPRSIVIAGISQRAGSFGKTTLANLARFQGEVYLVNPRYQDIDGKPCYPSLSALPQVPDCAVVAVGREGAEPLIQECADLGIGGCIVYAAGYSETGKPERIAMQSQLGNIARASGMRIAGPNCLGMVNYVSQALISFAAYAQSDPPAGRWIGIASQSGAMANSLTQVVKQGSPLGLALSAGNCCDVDVADLIAYLAEDPACGVIVSTFEGVVSGPRLIEAMDLAWKADKPLIIYKMASGRLGAEAAISHTGSMAGSNAAYRAAFDRYGVIAVDNFESLIESAQFFLKAKAPLAKGVAALNTSGGCTVMAADKAELFGVPLPQPTAAVQAVVAARIPDYGSARNPFDMTAQMLSDPTAFPQCADALMSDPNFGTVIMTTSWSSPLVAGRSQALGDAATRYGKMACNVWLSPWLDGPGAMETQQSPSNALFRSMDRCFATLAAWHRRGDLRAAGRRQAERVSAEGAHDETAALIGAVSGPTLTERASKQVLARYGIPVVSERLVQSAEEAVAAASEIGFPVVLKVESPDLPHKTEADVIRLNARNAGDVQRFHAEVLANAARAGQAGKPVRILGVLVQPMLGAGTEIVVGSRVDPQFGPLVLVGLGGVLVELLQDTAVELAPVTHDQALAMLDRLKAQQALAGFRGATPVDRDRVADVIVRVSEFASDHAVGVLEVDINPLICDGERVCAVDALIVRQA